MQCETKNFLLNARVNMVRNQIIPNGVKDKNIIDAFYYINKHDFVEKSQADLAYAESKFTVLSRREIIEAVHHSRMLQSAAITTKDLVLDIGCGYGYTAALLSSLAKKVFSIENSKRMVTAAEQNLQDYKNVSVLYQKNLEDGWPDKSPYNVIIVNGKVSTEKKLDALKKQLKTNGRLLCIKKIAGLDRAVLITKSDSGNYQEEAIFIATSHEIF